MMSLSFSIVRPRALVALFLAALPLAAPAAWQVVANEQGKRVEIDRASIVASGNGESVAKGRIVLDKPIVDPKTSVAYRIIEVVNRFDCAERTHATLKRSYYKEEGELLRQEEVRNPFDMPVRSGTPDDKLLREVCRPKGASAPLVDANKLVDKVDAAAGDLRKLNESLVEKEVKRDLDELSAKARSSLRGKGTGGKAAAPPASVRWDYIGEGGPEHWGALKSEYASCASGRRQSPIDVRNGFALDLAPVELSYRPAAFRVSDRLRELELTIYGGGFSLLGKHYALVRASFHRPAETTIAGKSFAMEAQLLHKADDGKLAMVSVLFEAGSENRFVQQALNYLPLDRGGEVSPPGQTIDPGLLFSANRGYFTFIGSLTSPPCTEDVLWVVMKEPQQVSAEQLAMLSRLYPPNARPLQAAFDRIIKESR